MRVALMKSLSHAMTSIQFEAPICWDDVAYVLEWSKHAEHGHLACNIALVLSKMLKQAPRSIAERLKPIFEGLEGVDTVEVAGPGFLNIWLDPRTLETIVADICDNPTHYGTCDIGQQRTVYLEYVSANPTGPLHVGHGRNAAIGSTLARVLSKGGYRVQEGYYVNDAGRQIQVLGLSCLIRARQALGQACDLPNRCYQGEYVQAIARVWSDTAEAQLWLNDPELINILEQGIEDTDAAIDARIVSVSDRMGHEAFQSMCQYASTVVLSDIQDDLSACGVSPHFLSEQSIYDQGAVDDLIKDLHSKGCLAWREGALWFKATDFGDEKDRVLKRANGQFTYFAADAAYHRAQLNQYEHMVNIWGSDHHGYVARIQAVLKALGVAPERLKCILVQFVNLVESGQRISMSTRSGSFVTLRQLRDDVGADVCRFFYLMRKFDQHMDFDLDLARTQSQDNPVYYVQYAHARICRLFDQAGLDPNNLNASICFQHLGSGVEPLLCHLAQYPDVIAQSIVSYEVHGIVFYLQSLATLLHRYYNTEHCLVSDIDMRMSRLKLMHAVQCVLKQGLELLGVQAPATM